MRTVDRPVPAVVYADATNLASWPVRPVVAISRTPSPSYAWDTAYASWDDPTPLVWDADVASPARIDATCDWMGLELTVGPPDDHTLFPSSHLLVHLDNRDGAWSQYNVDGSPALSGPGQAIDVWAHGPPVSPAVPAYLTPSVGTVSTPDPGPLPAQCVLVWSARATVPGSSASRAIASQWPAAPNRSWVLRRHETSGQFNFGTATNGTTTVGVFANAAVPVDATDETFAAAFDNTTTSVNRLRAWQYVNGTWVAGNYATATSSSATIFDTAAALLIGGEAGTPTSTYSGRLYWVELRTGLDPAAGSVIWRFDAADYPGTGTSYVDPRGRTWTLTTASAITPAVPAVPGDWWMFSGTIARWDELADETVEIEAFDALATLAQPVGSFTAGVAGDRLGPRLTAILQTTGRQAVPARFPPSGVVALTAQKSDAAPLEEMQIVAGSDGGVLYGDADGTVVAYDRTWRSGRPDQTVFPVISDNVCTADVIVWDPILSTNDTYLADTVVLQNLAGLRAQSPAVLSGTVIAETDQQWTTQAEGDTLAGALVAAQKQPRVALDTFDLYLLDPHQPNLWRAVDWRLFDVLRFVHDTKAVGGTARVDVSTLITALTHTINPDAWVMTVGTSRAQTYVTSIVWDTPQYVWDAAGAVWTY